MKKPLIIITLALALNACTNGSTSSENTGKKTIEEKLSSCERIESFTKMSPQSENFIRVFLIQYKQYIDHDNKALGTFTQQIEFGYINANAVNVYTSLGYYLGSNHSGYKRGENELAFLLNGNYLCVEHRYFGESLPVEMDFDEGINWDYLTTKQASDDAHDIVETFKTILNGKWISTGASKGGMTTELFAYYHPGDMDLYVPYVAPFCSSFNDKRMAHFIYEEAGNLQYDELRARTIRNEVLEFQVKMLSYRDDFAETFYQEGLSEDTHYSSYVTKDNLYDFEILEFAIGFWQYEQNVSSLERCLNLPETTAEEIATKKNRCYNFFKTVCDASDVDTRSIYSTYYVQAYQELGNYGYDFSYILDALEDDSLFTLREDEEDTIFWNMVMEDHERALPRKELMYTKINEMLRTTDQKFIMIYGSSDPWYAVRPDDVERDNINIYVNTSYPHSSCISNFPKSVTSEILEIINGYLA